MDYDFLRLSPMLVLIMSLGMIIPSRSISVGVIEGSDEELILPEYDDTREKGKDDVYKTNSTTCSDYNRTLNCIFQCENVISSIKTRT